MQSGLKVALSRLGQTTGLVLKLEVGQHLHSGGSVKYGVAASDAHVGALFGWVPPFSKAQVKAGCKSEQLQRTH